MDREPWGLEFYRLADGVLGLVGSASVGGAEELQSEVLPLVFRLVGGTSRPGIKVSRVGGGESWQV